ncbi:MAG: haloalkane dehalogenase, partial [Gammaproteobacteria bacterium]
MEQEISSVDPHPRKRMQVRDTEMAYVDVGVGRDCVFLHGNPTSSYLWRNVIAEVASSARCIAPDLVGMGESGPSPRHAYRLFEQAAYIDALFDALELDKEKWTPKIGQRYKWNLREFSGRHLAGSQFEVHR